MFESLKEIFAENWAWRSQIKNLALMDVKKSIRGAALGWVWLFVKPAVYIAVFWVALAYGLRSGTANIGDGPYILWLAAGLIPWFYMQSAIHSGANVFSSYSYLVNRIRFPMAAVSTFYMLSQFIVNCMIMGLFILFALLMGWPLHIYMIQLPFLYLIMLVFWTMFSVMMSPPCAISKDFLQLWKACSTPIFWLSGIIFDPAKFDVYPTFAMILHFNPVTFFARTSRACFSEQYWVWEKPEILIPFVIVFFVTAFFAVLSYHKLKKEVSDAF